MAAIRDILFKFSFFKIRKKSFFKAFEIDLQVEEKFQLLLKSSQNILFWRDIEPLFYVQHTAHDSVFFPLLRTVTIKYFILLPPLIFHLWL